MLHDPLCQFSRYASETFGFVAVTSKVSGFVLFVVRHYFCHAVKHLFILFTTSQTLYRPHLLISFFPKVWKLYKFSAVHLFCI